MNPRTQQITIGIGSLGSIGRIVANRIKQSMPEYMLTAVTAKHEAKARQYLSSIDSSAQVVALHDLSYHADCIVECAPAAVFRDLAEPVINAGKRIIVLSVGALLDNWDLVDRAKDAGAEILVPSGALLALDAVQATAEGNIESVHMTTRKPLAGLAGAPFVEENEIDLSSLTEPLLLFKGSARQAIVGFPANLNVAVALSLAGIGPDLTMLEIWADPGISRNTHTIQVDSDTAKLEFTVENIPSENPKTGKMTALSVVALLRKQVSPLRIGT